MALSGFGIASPNVRKDGFKKTLIVMQNVITSANEVIPNTEIINRNASLGIASLTLARTGSKTFR